MRREVLLVGACVVCLLAVASGLPAADPRIDDPVAGDWEVVTGGAGPGSAGPNDASTPERSAENTGRSDRETPSEVRPRIRITEPRIPGTEVTVDVTGPEGADETALQVNGKRAGTIEGDGRLTVEVPYATEMTVRAPGYDLSRTVSLRTDAEITHGPPVPDRPVAVQAHVGQVPIEEAAVYLDGERVNETDAEGRATVRLPATAGPARLRVRRGAVAANETVEVAEPAVRFVVPTLFPGFFAPVKVSAAGAPVPDARVSVGGGSVVTDDAGRAFVRLPVDDTATVTARVGNETATATAGNLYLRLAAAVVVLPGLAIGAIWTYLRVAAYLGPYHRPYGAALLAALGGLLDVFAESLRGTGAAWRSFARPRLEGISFPRIPIPSVAIPSVGGLRAVGGFLASLGATVGSSGGGIGSTVGGWLGRSGDDDAATGDESEGSALAPEPAGPDGPRAEVRAAWHAFLDRLGVENRATTTPGQVARRALAAGFPAGSVRRLVATFREIEYGGRAPSVERVAEARAAAGDLIDYEPEEGSE